MIGLAPQHLPAAPWPALPLDDWRDTYATVQLWTQILGKTRLALAPMQNHWWHAALYCSTRGVTTSPIPYGTRTFEVELDFIDHQLVVRTSDGLIRTFDLGSMPVADFYTRYIRLLHSVGIAVSIRPVPQEVADTTPFDQDRVHASYDADAAHRCWQILVQATRVIAEVRSSFLGKSSPVHFWWGAFDLAYTRFSGRPAPPHPGGVPYVSDRVVREAYSHECMSVGWWPGGGAGEVREPAVLEPSFYAYVVPEPKGFSTAVMPSAARYHPAMYEWLLPYDAVRTAADPDRLLREFLDGAYEAAATLGNWDRSALERPKAA